MSNFQTTFSSSAMDIPLFKLLMPLDFKNYFHVYGFHAIVQENIIADFLKN